jgi:hypothetical protein
MALTAMLAKDSADLRAHAALEFRAGRYHYEVKTKAGESSYSVTDGTDTLKTTLVWAFGSGPVGQTYLFKRSNGEIFEARVSYFDALQGLDFTPMLTANSPADLKRDRGVFRAMPRVRRLEGGSTRGLWRWE